METITSNMLAIVEQLEMEHNCSTDNAREFLILMLLKVFLDGGAMFLCWHKPLSSFINTCSISIIVVDLLLAVSMIATLWMDVEISHRALCYLMANFSATFSVLPVPIFCLGILDYYLEDAYAGRKLMKLVRNPVLTLMMWLLAGIYAHTTVNAILLEQTVNVNKYIICEIRESKIVTYSISMLTVVMFLALLPYFLRIPKWVKEADRIFAAREELDMRTSDLKIDMTIEEDAKWMEEKMAMPRPSMHISLMVCFALFWMPYLIVTTVCATFKFGIPAYIGVNLLWVQCVNSLLSGVVFWLRSDTKGPYSSLPENVCLWQAYWHLSTGTEAQHQMTVAMFNPSKRKGSTPFCI